jgi:hypothetical protein
VDHLASTVIHKMTPRTRVARAVACFAAVVLSFTASSPISAQPGRGASFANAVVQSYGLDDRNVSYAKTRVALTDADTHRLLNLTEENRSAFKAYLGGFKTFVTTNRRRDAVYIARSCCDRQEWFVGHSPVNAPPPIAAVAQEPIRIAGVGLGDPAAAVVRLFGAPNARDTRTLRYEGPRLLADPRSGCVTRYTFSLSAGRVVGMDFNNEC